MSNNTTCNTCGAVIFWCRSNRTGKFYPVDSADDRTAFHSKTCKPAPTKPLAVPRGKPDNLTFTGSTPVEDDMQARMVNAIPVTDEVLTHMFTIADNEPGTPDREAAIAAMKRMFDNPPAPERVTPVKQVATGLKPVIVHGNGPAVWRCFNAICVDVGCEIPGPLPSAGMQRCKNCDNLMKFAGPVRLFPDAR